MLESNECLSSFQYAGELYHLTLSVAKKREERLVDAGLESGLFRHTQEKPQVTIPDLLDRNAENRPDC